LILNANTANIKQLFRPEKLSGLSRNRPLIANQQEINACALNNEY